MVLNALNFVNPTNPFTTCQFGQANAIVEPAHKENLPSLSVQRRLTNFS